MCVLPFDYQLDRHCSKTRTPWHDTKKWFDYQLDRHCSKTADSNDMNGGPDMDVTQIIELLVLIIAAIELGH